jgi:hypothetical protein
MSALTDLERMLAEEACRRQIIRFARLNDVGDHEALAALFTQNAVFARPSAPDAPMVGREAILSSLFSRPPRLTRHVMSNIEVDIQAPERATARSVISLYQGDNGASPAAIQAVLIGAYDDMLHKVEGQWLFSERRGSLALKG